MLFRTEGSIALPPGISVNRDNTLLPQHVGFWLTKFLPSASTLC
jgi:hypothetical protein